MSRRGIRALTPEDPKQRQSSTTAEFPICRHTCPVLSGTCCAVVKFRPWLRGIGKRILVEASETTQPGTSESLDDRHRTVTNRAMEERSRW